MFVYIAKQPVPFLFQSKEELAAVRMKEIQAYKSEHVENVAAVLLCYDGLGTNDEILQALENKYDALRDKLLLEALRKQLGETFDFEYFKKFARSKAHGKHCINIVS
jgi:hypothetical protein